MGIDMHNIGGEESACIHAGILEAWTACLSPNDEVIAAGNHSGAVNLWSVADREKVASLDTGGEKLIMSNVFHPNGAMIAATTYDGSLYILDLASAQVQHKVQAHYLPARKVAYSVEGGLLFTASDDRHIGIFDTRTGLAVNSFSHSGMCLSLDVSSDGRHVVSACADHSIAYWDLGMQRCVQKFDAPHTEQVWDVSFNDSGSKIASAGEEGILQLYELSS